MIIATSLVASAANAAFGTEAMQGLRLKEGVACYTIFSGEREIGSTRQSVMASELDELPVWDIVVHQKVSGGAFDMRDHFIVDRKSMLPLRFESARGSERTASGWHRVSLVYENGRVFGTKETAAGVANIDVPFVSRVWDGNLWGLTFAALPLDQGASFVIPFWQYDKGFGSFTVQVVGSETVTTPDGPVDAWIVEAGDRPNAPVRYSIAKDSRQELSYTSQRGGQRIDADCA
jgi:hypothetical protein